MKAVIHSLFVSALMLITAQAGADIADLRELVVQYQLEQHQASKAESANILQLFKIDKVTPQARDWRCDEEDQDRRGPACTDTACELLGTYGCDSTSELREVADACRGNRNGNCLRENCTKLGTYGCDSISEIRQVGEMCRGARDRGCVDFACTKLGTYGCDSISELNQVNALCRDADTRCMESACTRLGTYGCDSISELQEVSNVCNGN